MFGSVILEVAIGLIFLYLLLSLVCSAIQEAIAGYFSMRAQNLATALRNMLGSSLWEQMLTHGMVKSQVQPESRGKSLPSYLSADTFSAVLLDLLHEDQPRRPRAGNPSPHIQCPIAQENLMPWFTPWKNR